MIGVVRRRRLYRHVEDPSLAVLPRAPSTSVGRAFCDRATRYRLLAGAGGVESEGTFPYRAALAVAERLGTEAVIFPSHHGGFGQQGDPDAFAATLRGVLADVD